MDRRSGLLFLSFLESFSTILLERGIYFYTEHQLAFTPSQNLALAFGFGATYVAGAYVSHAAAHRLGEKRLLALALAGLLLGHLVAMVNQQAALLCVVFIATGFLHGIKWPVIESFVTAGQTPRQVVRMIGRFNVAWSIAVPPAVAVVGPMLETPWPPMVFATAAALNVAALWLMRPLAARPVHLELDHPERPDAGSLQRYASLLVSSRWLLLAGYGLMFLIAPLLPEVFKALRLDPSQATLSASLIDVVRVLAFATLGLWTAWHGRAWPTWVGMVGLAAGFLLMLLGRDLPTVLLGEVLFGVALGVTYFAALYYAIVVRNAAVDAGGKHEALIGLGFAIGPLAGWFGHQMAGMVGGEAAGILVAAGPLFLLCAAGSMVTLPRGRNASTAARRGA